MKKNIKFIMGIYYKKMNGKMEINEMNKNGNE